MLLVYWSMRSPEGKLLEEAGRLIIDTCMTNKGWYYLTTVHVSRQKGKEKKP